MSSNRKLVVVLLVLGVFAMLVFTAFRYLALDDMQRGGLEFDGSISGQTAKIKVRSTFMEKRAVVIAAATLDGVDTTSSLPLTLGEVGPWKSFDLRFPALTSKGQHKLTITARYRTLFGSAAMSSTLPIEVAR